MKNDENNYSDTCFYRDADTLDCAATLLKKTFPRKFLYFQWHPTLFHLNQIIKHHISYYSPFRRRLRRRNREPNVRFGSAISTKCGACDTFSRVKNKCINIIFYTNLHSAMFLFFLNPSEKFSSLHYLLIIPVLQNLYISLRVDMCVCVA